MKNTRSIDFTRKSPKKKTVLTLTLIVIGAVAAGALSFLALLAANDFDVDRFFGTRAAEETTTSAAEEQTTDEEGSMPAFSDDNSVNVLVICGDSDKNLDFCNVVCVSHAEKVIRVKPVSPELTLEYAGGSYTLSELFTLSSAGAVREALNGRGLHISRYININETNFKMLMQKLGPVDVLIRNDISFAVDAITYSYPAGTQSMSSDALLKYMKYAASGDELLTLQAEAFAQILRTYFTADFVNRGEDFFSEFINLVSSDISAFDYTENRSELADFLAGRPQVNVIS